MRDDIKNHPYAVEQGFIAKVTEKGRDDLGAPIDPYCFKKGSQHIWKFKAFLKPQHLWRVATLGENNRMTGHESFEDLKDALDFATDRHEGTLMTPVAMRKKLNEMMRMIQKMRGRDEVRRKEEEMFRPDGVPFTPYVNYSIAKYNPIFLEIAERMTLDEMKIGQDENVCEAIDYFWEQNTLGGAN